TRGKAPGGKPPPPTTHPLPKTPPPRHGEEVRSRSRSGSGENRKCGSTSLVRSIPLAFEEFPESEMRGRAEAFYVKMRSRRSVREFSSRPVPREIIANCLRTAGAAPSGANLQPWHFAVLGDPAV